MTTAELAALSATQATHPWRVVALAVLAGLLAGVWLQHPESSAAAPVAAPPVIAPVSTAALAKGTLIDHSVLADPALLAEPDPAPAAVAAYDD